MIQFEIAPEFDPYIQQGVLTFAAEKTLSLSDSSPSSEFSLYLTDDGTLQELNKQYMGVDAPTDVLSFPVPFDNPESGVQYLGDIVISYPAAARQAKAAGHPVEEEIILLLVHGILHLVGHDHSSPEEKAAMWALQDEILTVLDVSARPPE